MRDEHVPEWGNSFQGATGGVFWPLTYFWRTDRCVRGRAGKLLGGIKWPLDG